MDEINKYKRELGLDILLISLSILLWGLIFFQSSPFLIIIYFFLSSMFFGIGLFCFITDAIKLNKLLNNGRRR